MIKRLNKKLDNRSVMSIGMVNGGDRKKGYLTCGDGVLCVNSPCSTLAATSNKPIPPIGMSLMIDESEPSVPNRPLRQG